MPRATVYGKRKKTNTSTTSAIFGTASSPDLKPAKYPTREPLEELANGLTNLSIRGTASKSLESLQASPRKDGVRLTPRKLRYHRPKPDFISPARDFGLRSSTPKHIPRIGEFQSYTAQHQLSVHSPSIRTPRQLRQQDPVPEDEGHIEFSPRRPQRSQPNQNRGSARTHHLSKKEAHSIKATEKGSIPIRAKIKPIPDDLALLPLVRTYKADCGRPLPIEQWDDVLPTGSVISKIAEASYAEVYRISIDGSESILKIMQLRMPSDQDSLDCRTASDPSQVVSELRIMNLLTELPGFVTFKAAHLIGGKACETLIKARNSCHTFDPANGLSEFPDPSTFTENSVSLVIELGDTGQCLDSIDIRTLDELWDIFLGVVVALTAAEYYAQFEHRDLHESNICVSFKEPKITENLQDSPKYGRSGFEVTILDYGLSRALLPDEVIVCNDLEQDLEIFRGDSRPQFDTYRRMRSHLFTGNRTMHPRQWHTEKSKSLNNGHMWDEYTPYSNVLWIKYILGYLEKDFKKHGGYPNELGRFHTEIKELKKRMNTKTLESNGAFMSAGEICDFVVEQGWIARNTLLSEGDSAIEANESTGGGEQ